MNVRNLIGFNTPSKEKAQSDLDSNSSNNSPLSGMNQVDSEKVKMETLQRLQQIGDTIISNDFQKYPPQQRQQILMDFAYYSKVADTIM